MTDALDPDRLRRLDEVMTRHADDGGVPGLAWAVERHGEAHVGFAGRLSVDGGGASVGRDSIFRISSMTKPVTAVAALMLVEDGRLRLDDPVDDLLPELADPQVMVDPQGSIEETVPAERPITVRDAFTFRSGMGMDFTAPWPQPTLEAMAALGLGAGPPAPAGKPGPDEWIARVGSVPLAHQPGTRWLYHTSAEVLGVLVARASGQAFDAFLRERILDPLGMDDTGFWVPAGSMARFGPAYTADGDVYDPIDGQWSTAPAFCGGGDGLVSTVDDYLAFGRALLGRGPVQLLARPTLAAMATNQIGDPVAACAHPTGEAGWGLGVGVQIASTDPHRSAGSIFWDGGLGSSWVDDPAQDLVGVLMTNQAFPSPDPPAVVRDFWATTYAAMRD